MIQILQLNSLINGSKQIDSQWIFIKSIFFQFTPKNSPEIELDFSYVNKLISKADDTKFLGIYVDKVLSWEIHFEQITHT